MKRSAVALEQVLEGFIWQKVIGSQATVQFKVHEYKINQASYHRLLGKPRLIGITKKSYKNRRLSKPTYNCLA